VETSLDARHISADGPSAHEHELISA
jgi:hypothetical protein